MNNRQLYLAWLRTTAPETYSAVMRKVSGKPRSTGGLQADLVTNMFRPSTGFGFLGQDSSDMPEVDVTATPITDTSYTLPTIDTSTFENPTLDQSVTMPDVTITPAPAAPSSDIWANVIKGVTSITAAALTTSAQSNLVKVNTQRAQQGLPPVDANGVPIRPSYSLYSSNPTLRNLEASISGSSMTPILLIGGLALVALLMFKRA